MAPTPANRIRGDLCALNLQSVKRSALRVRGNTAVNVTRWVGLIASTVIVAVLCAGSPASAVTAGPSEYGPGTTFDVHDIIHGPGDEDDPWLAYLDVVEVGGSFAHAAECFADDYGTCTLDSALIAGHTYYAQLTESGGGYWHCSIYNQDVCSWNKPYSYAKKQYVFTYSGAVQSLTRYYATVSIGISKKKTAKKYRWRLSCTVEVAGAAERRNERTVKFEYRDARHPSWRPLGSRSAGSGGRVTVAVDWPPPRGSVRCVTDADSETEQGVSSVLKMPVRR